ncbi:hypothetical protein [Bacillus sp. SRB3LM]|nr:hypothetical protein [Bacillus sp. SRB3LM]
MMEILPTFRPINITKLMTRAEKAEIQEVINQYHPTTSKQLEIR